MPTPPGLLKWNGTESSLGRFWAVPTLPRRAGTRKRARLSNCLPHTGWEEACRQSSPGDQPSLQEGPGLSACGNRQFT